MLLPLCLSFVLFGFGQNKLTGKVVDFNNKPVAKAKIYLDSTYSKVVTNKNGDFEVLIPEKVKTINIYSDKYGVVSSNYNNENSLNFTFSEADKSKKIKKGSDSAYSETDQKYVASQSDNPNISKDKRTYRTIYEMIRGKVAGVSVSNDNKITIRGTSTLREFAGQPLFVVNGMVVANIDYVIPNNVKSIKVLKDTEASIYGSQGANGVIVIKTF